MKLLTSIALMSAVLANQAFAEIDVCALPKSVRSDIATFTGNKPCYFITAEDLALVKTVSLHGERLAIDGDELLVSTLDGFTGLENLYLDSLYVPGGERSFFRDLVSLKNIAMSSSVLPAGPNFESQRLVETLKLRHVSGTVSADFLLGMESLKEFSMNNSHDLPAELFSHSPLLERIDLSSNSAEQIPETLFAGLTELRSLNLYGLRAKALPEKLFAGLVNLQDLSLLGANQITEVPELLFQDLVKLQHLRLDTANIVTLPAKLFRNLAEIRGIYMGYGKLQTLPAGLFDNLDLLAIIELYHNEIRDLPRGIFNDLPSLILVSIYGNKLTEEEQAQLKKDLGDKVFL